MKKIGKFPAWCFSAGICVAICMGSCKEAGKLFDGDFTNKVTLLVTDTLARPVRQAAITLYKIESTGETKVSSTLTDEAGVICYYDLNVGNYKVKYAAEALGFAGDSVAVQVINTPLQHWDLELKFIPLPVTRGHAVVTLKDSSGTAQVGKNLLLYATTNGDSLVSVMKSDSYGKVKYYNLPAGSYKVVNTFRSDSLPVQVAAGQTQQVNLTLHENITLLSKISWTIAGFSSQQNATNYAAAKIIDNSPVTFWNSSWSLVPRPTHPHYVTIDMGMPRSLKGFVLQNAPYSSGGWPFRQFEMLVSMDNSNWESAGFFQQPPRENTIEQFYPLGVAKTCRYFKFQTINHWHTDPNATVTLAEIGAFN